MTARRANSLCMILAVTLQCSCGGGAGSSAGAGGSTGGVGTSAIPQFAHVFVLVEENHSFNDVIGNTNMPYLNILASGNGLATQYYADAHPSLPNYFVLTVGGGTSITGRAGDAYEGC